MLTILTLQAVTLILCTKVYGPVKPATNRVALGSATVGLTTIHDCDMKWGHGRVLTGGHPGGRRQWRIGSTSLTLTIDGFNGPANGNSDWLEDLTVSYQKPEKPNTPIVLRSPLAAGAINLHWFNQPSSKVLEDLKAKGFQIEASKGKVTFSYGSYLPAEKRQVFATLLFHSNRLTYINLVIDSQ